MQSEPTSSEPTDTVNGGSVKESIDEQRLRIDAQSEIEAAVPAVTFEANSPQISRRRLSSRLY